MKELIGLCDDIWTIDGKTKFAPGAHIQGRCTIVRQKNGGLLVYSPIALDDDMWAQVTALGDIETLFAPNLYHHMFLADAQKRFGKARVMAPQGLSKKNRSVRYDELLTPLEHAAIPDEFEAVFIEGAPQFDEIVLLHKPSHTLIVGDYFFNVQKYEGWLARPLLRLTDTLEKPTQSKLWRRVTRDKVLMKASAQKVLGLDFERIVMCHGEPLLASSQWARGPLSWLEP